jgi:hypothetical protein
MFLRLENTSAANVKKLIDYANQLNLHLSPVEGNTSSPDLAQSVSVDKTNKTDMPLDTDEDEVTHEVFFGENIKRAINTLWGHKK